MVDVKGKKEHIMLSGGKVEVDEKEAVVTIENHKVKEEEGVQFELNSLCTLNRTVKVPAQNLPNGKTVTGMSFNTILWDVTDDQGLFKEMITKVADYYAEIGHEPDHGFLELASGSIRIADILYPQIGGESIRKDAKVLSVLTDIISQIHNSSVDLLAKNAPNFIPVYKNFPTSVFEASLPFLRVGEYIFILDMRQQKVLDAINSIPGIIKIEKPGVYIACNVNGSQTSAITRV